MTANNLPHAVKHLLLLPRFAYEANLLAKDEEDYFEDIEAGPALIRELTCPLGSSKSIAVLTQENAEKILQNREGTWVVKNLGGKGEFFHSFCFTRD